MESEPPFDRREIRRYMRDGGSLPGDVLEEGIRACRGLMKREVLYEVFPLALDGDEADLGFARVRSGDLARALSGCDRVVLFAATAGFGFDRAAARERALSPLRALTVHAVGAERVEALCDAFCAHMAAEAEKRGRRTRPRFSPGYGDLPLSLQEPIARALGMERIGIVLDRSLMMRPSKSVTALIGLEKAEGGCEWDE